MSDKNIELEFKKLISSEYFSWYKIVDFLYIYTICECDVQLKS